jgi:hypothetical protein
MARRREDFRDDGLRIHGRISCDAASDGVHIRREFPLSKSWVWVGLCTGRARFLAPLTYE